MLSGTVLTDMDLHDIAGREMAVDNPLSLEGLAAIGEALGLRAGQRLIDYGCGYGTALVTWALRHGITGEGVDVRPAACERARARAAAAGVQDRVAFACGDGRAYPVEPHAFDAAACLGATFIWGGFAETLAALRRAVRPGGRVAVGEVYWLAGGVPAEVAALVPGTVREGGLLAQARAAGFEVLDVVRATAGDWDAYEGGRVRGLLGWAAEHPRDPDRDMVLERAHAIQDAWLGWQREHLGWAVYVMST